MHVDVYSTPNAVSEMNLRGRTVIVVDVLRAVTTIITALHSGALQIIPAQDAGLAARMASNLDKADVVLAGENDSLRINGFDLGNSPLEFTREHVKGKTVVLSTANCAKVFDKVPSAARVYLGAMINRTAVAQMALEAGNDIALVCCGTEGRFSCDDVCCAGAICDALFRIGGAELEWNDLSRAARLLYQCWKNGTFSLGDTLYYSKLEKLGFRGDLEFCFREDATDLVPYYDNGVISH